MRAARIHRFGPPEVIVIEDMPCPAPAAREVLVRVMAGGVGPWDALIREGKSKVSPPPPLTLGSDLSGVVEAVGPGVTEFKKGDEVYGVTNPQFCGAHAEYALASADMVSHKPRRLTHVEAASVPVVAVTAWQMLFEYAHVVAGQSVLILGAAGNVGAYAVQFAASAGVNVDAMARAQDAEFVRGLGAELVVNYQKQNYQKQDYQKQDDQKQQFEEAAPLVDVVIDTVGGETRERSLRRLKPGGILVSVVSPEPLPPSSGVRSVFFYAEVTTARLNTISEWLDRGKLVTNVGTVLSLDSIRTAHEMLAGAPHQRGKIVLTLASTSGAVT